jgi:hypothetical protein
MMDGIHFDMMAIINGGFRKDALPSQRNRRQAFERGLEEILGASGGDREEAIFQAAALLGGVSGTRGKRSAAFG